MRYWLDAHGWGFPWWHGLLGSILPLLFLLGIGALVVWGVLRVTERGRPLAERWSPAAARSGDSALEQARLRYARGEISREEFLQISADLGARADSPPPSGSSTEPGAGARPEGGSSQAT